MSEIYDLIVVGGGASGMMAAGQAAQKGKRVLLIEKKERPGRKLRITGKGRCNITNTLPLKEFLEHVGPNPDFLNDAFSQFFSKELITFFNRIGLRTKIERGNRVFPLSDKAQDVVDCMHDWILAQKVRCIYQTSVQEILTDNNKVIGVQTENGQNYESKAVVLTTGGKSYPLTGSTGDGYVFAESLGHKVTDLFPALVPLETKCNAPARLDKLTLKNVKLTVWINNEKQSEHFGDIAFVDGYLTGPITLTLSRRYVKEISQGKKFVFSVDLKSALSETKLDNRINRDIEKFNTLRFRELLRKFMPKQLALIALEQIGISPNKMASHLSPNDKIRFRTWMKDFRFEITNVRPFKEAIVTMGGVDTNEINPQTMESKLIKNLYFAGEVLDLDADTGGYNLQIAFSTGWVVGNSV